MSSFVSVIGTVFVDCKGFSKNEYIPTGRNLGSIQFVHGGVGRNVAENLTNLDLATSFVSTVDSTGLGDEIIQRLKKSNAHTEYLGKINQGMGMWLAVLDENGNLAGSISQMPQLDELERIIDNSGKKIVQQSTHIVLELDLNEQISKRVVELSLQENKPVFGIPGNLDVILSNMSLLNQLECFICNDIEAGRLLGKNIDNLNQNELIQELISFVDSSGLRSMVITLGENGSIYYDSRSKESGYQPVFPVKLVDSSGAGDAFFSGTVMGLVRGLTLKEAVVCGTKVAGWTIESQENNCPDLRVKFKQDEYFQGLLVKK
ncbi:PfkB family carbohydrate kinase [Paenibacillus radicis (ex Xue et al. 2023)]|uniref:PfkB family carbohydrate kinase n=1 Tax=Paenibacillus radicis (ex Xue et al. 2023) TaxID=2972489 RepID=A0ABT1YS35_9BACL|nr:PfkB family carbohydrate kinase [Paenibacillus radicis (ex Xue et al. 2023)]MCR8635993.1 PfkB family carbohydrate kinase [Paenibacillus radicis (ex Xue et al. 2023)]